MTAEAGTELPTHRSKLELCGSFNDFFVSKIEDLRSVLDAKAGGHVFVDESIRDSTEIHEFSSFSLVSVDTILSCPLDPIPTSIVKRYAEILAYPIMKIVNLSLESGDFPCSLSHALVTPLLKSPTLFSENLSNYRPISQLSFLSKLLERTVATQLSKHLGDNNLHAPMQSAYRPQHSTETALLRVTNDLLAAVDQGKAIYLVLLDQSAAFDIIDHGILLKRLSSRFKLSERVLAWMTSYLSSRTQSVSLSRVSSTATTIKHGVTQGSVLGPLLFTLYIVPLSEIAQRHGLAVHFYADDVQLYVSFLPSTDDDQQKAIDSISACFAEMKAWMESWSHH